MLFTTNLYQEWQFLPLSKLQNVLHWEEAFLTISGNFCYQEDFVKNSYYQLHHVAAYFWKVFDVSKVNTKKNHKKNADNVWRTISFLRKCGFIIKMYPLPWIVIHTIGIACQHHSISCKEERFYRKRSYWIWGR